MSKNTVIIASFLALFGMSITAQAQGIVGGAEQGAVRGHRAAGPVGAVVGGAVGGAVGGVVGGVRGALGLRHRRYVHPYRYARPVAHPRHWHHYR